MHESPSVTEVNSEERDVQMNENALYVANFYMSVNTISLFLLIGEVVDIPGAQRKVSAALQPYKLQIKVM